MIKMKKPGRFGKKASGLYMIFKAAFFIFALIVIIILIINLIKNPGMNILSIFDTFSRPPQQLNDYFTADYIEPNSTDLAAFGCREGKTADQEFLIECSKPNPQIEFYVGINNGLDRTLYASAKPEIGINCNKNGCSKYETVEGNIRCAVAKTVVKCPMGFKYTFSLKTLYHVYPGAKMTYEDYYDLTKEAAKSEILAVNTKSYYVVQVK